MPAFAPGVTVIATKMQDTTVQLQFMVSNALRFCAVIPAADFTSFNTTVNGGATGATLTTVYAQDLNKIDYPNEYVPGV